MDIESFFPFQETKNSIILNPPQRHPGRVHVHRQMGTNCRFFYSDPMGLPARLKDGTEVRDLVLRVLQLDDGHSSVIGISRQLELFIGVEYRIYRMDEG